MVRSRWLLAGCKLAFPLLIVWSHVLFAQDVDKVPGSIWQKVQKQGVVRVIVDLNVPGWTSKKLSKEAEVAQRQKIADTQSQLLDELVGTQYKIRAQFKTVPGLALEVGPDALAVLERSPRVVKASENVSIPVYPGEVKVIGPVEKKQPSK